MVMDGNRTALERAFDLANSGACDSIDDIRRSLRREGYGDAQIIGTTLRRQLRVLMAQARGAHSIQAESSSRREP